MYICLDTKLVRTWVSAIIFWHGSLIPHWRVTSLESVTHLLKHELYDGASSLSFFSCVVLVCILARSIINCFESLIPHGHHLVLESVIYSLAFELFNGACSVVLVSHVAEQGCKVGKDLCWYSSTLFSTVWITLRPWMVTYLILSFIMVFPILICYVFLWKNNSKGFSFCFLFCTDHLQTCKTLHGNWLLELLLRIRSNLFGHFMSFITSCTPDIWQHCLLRSISVWRMFSG